MSVALGFVMLRPTSSPEGLATLVNPDQGSEAIRVSEPVCRALGLPWQRSQSMRLSVSLPSPSTKIVGVQYMLEWMLRDRAGIDASAFPSWAVGPANALGYPYSYMSDNMQLSFQVFCATGK